MDFFREATAETVAACIDAGADVNAPIASGTPLHVASLYNWDPEVFTVLLAAGADVNARDAEGSTPLHLAAAVYLNPDVVAEIVVAGADINARDLQNNTPLHKAWSNRNPAVIRRLLELGADRTARNNEGRIADPESCDYWNTRVFSVIAGADAVTRCLEAGAEVNVRDDQGHGAGSLGGTCGTRHADTTARCRRGRRRAQRPRRIRTSFGSAESSA